MLNVTTTSPRRAVVIAVTSASGATAVIDSDATSSASLDDPSVTMNMGAETCLVFMDIHSFLTSIADITEGASYTSIAERDDGTDVCGWARSTSTMTGDQTANWATTSAAAVNLMAVAIAESGGGGAATTMLDPMGMRGFFGG